MVQVERELVVSALLEPPSAMFGAKPVGVHGGTGAFALGGTIIERAAKLARSRRKPRPSDHRIARFPIYQNGEVELGVHCLTLDETIACSIFVFAR